MQINSPEEGTTYLNEVLFKDTPPFAGKKRYWKVEIEAAEPSAALHQVVYRVLAGLQAPDGTIDTVEDTAAHFLAADGTYFSVRLQPEADYAEQYKANFDAARLRAAS